MSSSMMPSVPCLTLTKLLLRLPSLRAAASLCKHWWLTHRQDVKMILSVSDVRFQFILSRSRVSTSRLLHLLHLPGRYGRRSQAVHVGSAGSAHLTALHSRSAPPPTSAAGAQRRCVSGLTGHERACR